MVQLVLHVSNSVHKTLLSLTSLSQPDQGNCKLFFCSLLWLERRQLWLLTTGRNFCCSTQRRLCSPQSTGKEKNVPSVLSGPCHCWAAALDSLMEVYTHFMVISMKLETDHKSLSCFFVFWCHSTFSSFPPAPVSCWFISSSRETPVFRVSFQWQKDKIRS